MNKYIKALVLLIKGAWKIWIGALTSLTLLVHTANVAASHSKKLEHKMGTATEGIVDWTGNVSDAIAGDSSKSDKALAATADSLAAERKKSAALQAALKAKRKATKSASPFKVGREARRSKPNTSAASHLRQPTAAEQQRQQGEQEGQHWDTYIDASSLRDFARTGLFKVGKPVAAGTITSSASVATYKNLVFRVQFTLKKGEVLTQEEVATGFLSPGGTFFFKSRLKVPTHTQSISCTLIGAEYLLAP